MNDLAIYIHFPFCLSKCKYCAFYSIIFNESLANEVFEKIILDLEKSSQILGKRNITSVFFGGGTPSLMSKWQLDKILSTISKFYNLSNSAEITLEANPDTLSDNIVRDFRQIGVNRLSLGVQSFINEELKFLGRRGNKETIDLAINSIKKYFDNYSLDLIYALPNQSRENLINSLSCLTEIAPPHVSCYRLTYEAKTPLYEALTAGKIQDISEELEDEFFSLICNCLSGNGLNRYEVSNFAKPGYESKHNYAYWNYADYLGIGPAAHSRLTIDGKKYAIEHPNDIKKWMNEETPAYCLSDKEIANEAKIIGLRTENGVDKKYVDLENSVVKKFFQEGILIERNNRIAISSKYLNVCDYIIKEIT